MIDYIQYSVNGITYTLENNGDGTWIRPDEAPSVAGNYLLTMIVSQGGEITILNSSNDLYETYLDMIIRTEKTSELETYVPDFISETKEFAEIFHIENANIDDLHSKVEKIKSNNFIVSASNDSIIRIEKFLNMKGLGTLEQRKSYLVSLNQKGSKINEATIKNIVNAISGSDCIITFFGSDESLNPEFGHGFLRVEVLSPDSTKNYRYADIARALGPLVPSHIKLGVIKYFATWQDILDDFTDWSVVASLDDWQAVNDYIAL